MKTTTTLKCIIAICFIAFTIVLPACKKEKTEPVITPVKNNIAYIYKSDNTDGLAYKTLMEENNCHVTLVDKSNISTIDYSVYHLLVIDHNTDGAGLASSWTKADSAAIIGSGKPMLLMGLGGLRFATKIKNTSNYLNTSPFSDNRLWVVDKFNPVYHQPHTIAIPTSTPQLKLYPSPVAGAGQLAPSGVLGNVTLLGAFVVDNKFYPVTIEKSKFVVFGFYKGVDGMTTDGRNFIVNLSYNIANLEQ